MAVQQVPVPPTVEPTGAKDSPVPESRIGEEANVAPTGLRADPQAWRAFLQTLEHYDPNYPYNPAYEYGPDWTDDPSSATNH